MVCNRLVLEAFVPNLRCVPKSQAWLTFVFPLPKLWSVGHPLYHRHFGISSGAAKPAISPMLDALCEQESSRHHAFIIGLFLDIQHFSAPSMLLPWGASR
jgi:hypothetical protein